MFKINPVKQAFDDDMLGYGGTHDYIKASTVKKMLSYNDEQLLKTAIVNLLESFFFFTMDLTDCINNPTVLSFYDGMHKEIDKIIMKVKSYDQEKKISISADIYPLIEEAHKLSHHSGVSPFAQLNIAKCIDYFEFMLKKDSEIQEQFNIK